MYLWVAEEAEAMFIFHTIVYSYLFIFHTHQYFINLFFKAPTIGSISPNPVAPYMDFITIDGTNFGPSGAPIKVLVEYQFPAIIISNTDSQIVAQLPILFYDDWGISVDVNNQTSSEVTISVFPPEAESIESSEGDVFPTEGIPAFLYLALLRVRLVFSFHFIFLLFYFPLHFFRIQLWKKTRNGKYFGSPNETRLNMSVSIGGVSYEVVNITDVQASFFITPGIGADI